MSDLKIQGVVEMSAEGAERVLDRVGDKAVQMAAKTEKAAQKAGDAVDGIGAGANGSADQLTRAEGRMLASIKRVQTQFELAGKTASQTLEYKIDAKGLDAAKFEPALAKLRELEAAALHAGSVSSSSLNVAGISAKQLSASLRGVPAQFTDIITSLQGGQAPLTVLMQQGGQLKDMFGGAGNAAKALGGYVLGLASPLTVTAGAAAALAVAYHQGAAESEAFNKSLIMTGNIAGTTAGQLGDMAKTVAGSSGATIGAVAETLNEITASGKVSADMLAKVAQAAIDMERAGGSAAADTVKEFSSLGDVPVSALIKLNDKYHFLTASVYEQVKALQDQGRETDAAKLAQETYANAIESRVPALVQNIGYLETAWKGVWGAVKGYGDAALSIGRESTLSDQLAAVKKKIELASSGPVWGDIYNNSSQDSNPDLEKQKRVLEAMIAGEKSVTEQVAAQNKAREAGLAWSQESAKYSDQQANKQAEILRVTTMMTDAGKSQAEIAKVLTQIEEKYAEKKGASAKAVKEGFTELFQRAEQMKAIYAALGVELKEVEKQNTDYAKSIAALIDPIEKEAASLELQAENYGLTRSQIEQTTIARLEEAKALAAMNGAGEDAIAFYEREIDARKRIAAASASVESRKATDDAAKHAADEWKKTSEKIGDSITDALMRGFESGKSFAETLRDTVVNMFNTMVLKPVIQATVMGGLSALGMGPALAGDSSSVLGMASLGNSAYNAYAGGGIASGFLSGMASAGSEAALGAAFVGPSATLAGGSVGAGASVGSMFGSAASGIAAAIPYVGLAAGAAALLSSAFGSGGTPHAGGIAFSTPTGTVTPNTSWGIDAVYKDANGVRLGDQFAENDWTKRFSQGVANALKPTAEAINGMLNSTASTFGFKSGYTTGLAFSSDGEDKSRGRLGIIDGYGTEVAQIMRKYSVDASNGIQGLIGDAGNSARGALYAMDLPAWADKLLISLGASANIDALSATVTQINAIAKAAETLAPAFKMSADDFATVYLKAGGDAMSAYYNAITTSAEKQAAQLNQITDAFGNLGYSLPDSIESFRALAESQDSTTTAGQNTIASLMGLTAWFAQFRASVDGLQNSASNAIEAFRTPDQSLALRQNTLADLSAQAGIAVPTSGSQLVALFDSINFANPTKEDLALASALPGIASAFSALETALRSTSASAKAIAEERKGLQDQLDALTMTTAQSREKELFALDASNRALQERIYLLNDSAAIESERQGLQDQIDALTMSTAEARAKELSALDSSNRALQERINSLNDEAAIASERKGLQDQIDAIVMTTTASRTKELLALDVSNRALQERIYALNDEAAATAASKEVANTAVSDAFAAVQRAVSAQKTTLEADYAAQKASWADAIDAATEVKNTLSSLSDTLSNAVKTVAVESPERSLALRAAAQMTLNSALVASQSGQSLAPFADAIGDAITDLSAPSKSLYTSFEDYARSQGRANAALSALSLDAASQKPIAQRTLDAIIAASDEAAKNYESAVASLDQSLVFAQSQIDATKEVNASVLSVGEAFALLAKALDARAGLPATTPATSSIAALDLEMEGAWSARAVTVQADTVAKYVAEQYVSALGRTVDTGGLAFWVDKLKTGAVAMADFSQTLVNTAKHDLANPDYRAQYVSVFGTPSFAVGTNQVPYDMTAQIHKDERIIPAADNRLLMSRLASNDSGADLLAELKALREEVNLLRYEARATASNTGKTAKSLEKFDIDGMPAERAAA